MRLAHNMGALPSGFLGLLGISSDFDSDAMRLLALGIRLAIADH
jgi:hypothetical protein